VVAVPVAGALGCAYVFLVMAPQLPSLEVLTDYQPKLPMRIYTSDRVLIGEFGAERRDVVRFADIPDVMKRAVLAIEDSRFYAHGGVDFEGVIRAGMKDLTQHGSTQGASTITMQLARNFFLSSEKTYTRKIYEMMLAWKIEHSLTKDQILEVYMNQIYLGERAYGFAAAAHVYFGKDLKDISLAEAAMLAGLPKAPSAYNPVANPVRAKVRQEYILRRMLELGYISAAQYDGAIREQIRVGAIRPSYLVHGEYVAEMVRQMLFDQYHGEAYTRGLNVTTTINARDQEAAWNAVRKGVLDYERRHEYRGPEGYVSLPENPAAQTQAIDEGLNLHAPVAGMVAAVVLSATPAAVDVRAAGGVDATVSGPGLAFGQDGGTLSGHGIRRGAVVRIMQADDGSWAITQIPEVQGALVAVSPQDGAIRALVGGFDFGGSKFNHVTSAWRQPGSSFKPFIYSAALEKGIGPATIINDAPLYFPPASPGAEAWEPKDDDRPEGPMSMRVALQKSKNLVSIRILSYIGTRYAQSYVTSRFGFDVERTPPYLPMALGAGLVTPLQSACAYAVFANGGYRINPYIIGSVTDARGTLLSHASALTVGVNAPRVLDARNAYIMNSLLHSVATGGTGAGTNILQRSDLQGKTGTTNDAKDGWFAGYQRSLVAVAWMGYDQPRSLGSREFGAQLALPIWVDYMRQALESVPESEPAMPDGLMSEGGELYYSDRQRGGGFVASIGVEAGVAGQGTDTDADSPDTDDDGRDSSATTPAGGRPRDPADAPEQEAGP
jgi:penicillin-binding protein 1A